MTDNVQHLAQGLAMDGGELKLWSVLVTCLGDLSLEAPTEVSGLTLSALVDRIGLRPQAMRVALHRLKRDGWVESRRVGRVGYHRLSDEGLQQTRAVAERIYGPAAAGAKLRLVGVPPGAQGLDGFPASAQAVALSRQFALVVGDPVALPSEYLVADLGTRDLPDWVRDIVHAAACEAEFAALMRLLRDVPDMPEMRGDPLERLALRVLVLHGWRRLALRSNSAAEAALGADRAEAACRAQVHAILERLGRSDPGVLDHDLRQAS